MDQAILAMLEQYDCKTDADYENALKQIIQQVVLLGLWRAKFFEHAAFYGGTALRILYGLDRFSEDLDFSLLSKDNEFNLGAYNSAIENELSAFGFKVDIAEKVKNKQTAIQSAFLKANTREHLLKVSAPPEIQQRTHAHSLLKVKFELDTLPPLCFTTESKPLLMPIPFWVNSYTLPCLFAGKLSAVLCRQWGTRVKGRDWYDFLWFVQRNTKVDLQHLEQRLRDVEYYTDSEPLSLDHLKQLLREKVQQLDVNLAKQDIVKFIREPNRLDGWSQQLFLAAVDGIEQQVTA